MQRRAAAELNYSPFMGEEVWVQVRRRVRGLKLPVEEACQRAKEQVLPPLLPVAAVHQFPSVLEQVDPEAVRTRRGAANELCEHVVG
jgi:hypothetical protein